MASIGSTNTTKLPSDYIYNMTSNWDGQTHILTLWFGFSMLFNGVSAVACIILAATIYLHDSFRRQTGVLIIFVIWLEFLVVSVGYLLTHVVAFSRRMGWESGIDCVSLVIFHGAAIMSVTWANVFLAVNRYVAILHPYRYRAWNSKFVISAMAIGSLAVGIALMFAKGQRTFNFRQRKYDCAPADNIPHIENIQQILGIFIPTGVTILIYIILLLQYRLRCRVEESNRTNSLARQRQRHKNIVLILLASTLYYTAVLIVPPIFNSFFPEVWFNRPVLVLWFRIVTSSGYSANAILFAVVNAEYRSAVKTVFQRTFGKRGVVLPSVSRNQPASK